MANNYIEEFFIGIGFDTKRVRKESKDIDNLLNNMTKKRNKAATEEGRIKAKVYKQTRLAEADNTKAFLLNEKRKTAAMEATNRARIKQAVGGLTAKTGASKAKDSAAVFSSFFSSQEEMKKKGKEVESYATKSAKDSAEIFNKHYKDKNQKAQRMNDMLLKNEKKQVDAAKKAEKAKRDEIAKTIQKNRERAREARANIERSTGYRNLNRSGNLGDIGTRMNRAVSSGDVNTLKNLKAEIRDVNTGMKRLTRTQVGLHTVQGGLTDSTRNMIRSYASVFALFQGTVAIKKVGQELESLNASMLVVSDSEADAASKMKFVREQAFNLGMDLKTTAKAYLGLSASSGDALGEDGVRGLFTSVLGISKAFGMSVDDTKGTFKAFTQINGLTL